MTRSREQKSGCEGLERNAKPGVVTPEDTYVLVYAHNALPGAEVCV